MGQRIRSRREALGISAAELAQYMKVAYKEVWAWENGKYAPHLGRHSQLAKILKWTVQDLRLGPQVARTDGSFPATQSEPISVASRLTRRFLEGLSQLTGEPFQMLSTADRRLGSTSCLPKIIQLCDSAVSDILTFTSGREIRDVKDVLNVIVRIAETAREQGARGAEQLSYDANDAAVQCAIHTVRASELKHWTDGHEEERAAERAAAFKVATRAAQRQHLVGGADSRMQDGEGFTHVVDVGCCHYRGVRP